MLIKEWKLCMHPFAYVAPVLSLLVLVPGYPYGVCCFYTALGIFFICLTARENHDAAYTLMLPVSRSDAVKARILFCAVLEVIDVLLMGVFILVQNAIGNMANPAGLDAGLALIGEGFILFAVFNMIFFPVYYRDVNKPGKAFVIASAAMFALIILEVVGTYTIPFFRDILDRPDPLNMGDKALFTLGGLALFAAGTAWSALAAEKRYGAVDLTL
jgi:hypothetical protein